MLGLKEVDFDPFADASPAPALKLKPVEGDPFAPAATGTGTAPVAPTPPAQQGPIPAAPSMTVIPEASMTLAQTLGPAPAMATPAPTAPAIKPVAPPPEPKPAALKLGVPTGAAPVMSMIQPPGVDVTTQIPIPPVQGFDGADEIISRTGGPVLDVAGTETGRATLGQVAAMKAQRVETARLAAEQATARAAEIRRQEDEKIALEPNPVTKGQLQLLRRMGKSDADLAEKDALDAQIAYKKAQNAPGPTSTSPFEKSADPAQEALRNMGETPSLGLVRNTLEAAGKGAVDLTIDAATGALRLGMVPLAFDPSVGETVDSLNQKLKGTLNGFSPDPARDEELAAMIAQGGASTVMFALGGLGLAKGLGMGQKFATSLVGGLPMAEQQWQQAVAQGQIDGNNGELRKWVSFVVGGGLGASEALPIGRMFERLEQSTGGALTRKLGQIAASAGEEGVQEFLQTIGKTYADAKILGIDPDSAGNPFEAALVGAITGGAMTGVGMAAQAAKRTFIPSAAEGGAGGVPLPPELPLPAEAVAAPAPAPEPPTQQVTLRPVEGNPFADEATLPTGETPAPVVQSAPAVAPPATSAPAPATSAPAPATSAPAETSAPAPAAPPVNAPARVTGPTGDIIDRKAREYGLDPDLMHRIARIESGGNPNAKNPNSSAGGLYQFIDGTWKQYGNGKNKFDAEANTDAAMRLTKANVDGLRKALGRDPTPGEIYMAHQQGLGGAIKILKNPNANAVATLGSAAVLGNGGNANMTNGQFAQLWTNKLNNVKGDVAGGTPRMDAGSTSGVEGEDDALLAEPPQPDAPGVSTPEGAGKFDLAPKAAGPDSTNTISTNIPEIPKLETRPVVVDLASGFVYSSDMEGYDPALQPRDRETRKGAGDQVREIASRLDPEQLKVGPYLDRGPPIVDSRGMVESGNGRTMAIRRAYENNLPGAQAYRQALAAQGYDVSGMSMPIMVQQRVTPLTPAQVQQYVHRANKPAVMTMSPAEQAKADSKIISEPMLSALAAKPNLATNREFAAGFMAKMTPEERNALQDENGNASQSAMTRMRNAVFAAAYGETEALGRMAESTDDNTKSLSNVLLEVAPVLMNLKQLIADGVIPERFDLTQNIVDAVNRISQMREKGNSLEVTLSQQDAFDPIPTMTAEFMRLFYNEKGTRQASQQRISDGIRMYAQEASKVSENGLALGGPKVEPQTLVQNAFAKVRSDDGNSEGKPDLFTAGGTGSGRPAGNGPGAAAGGTQVRGQEAAPARVGDDQGNNASGRPEGAAGGEGGQAAGGREAVTPAVDQQELQGQLLAIADGYRQLGDTKMAEILEKRAASNTLPLKQSDIDFNRGRLEEKRAAAGTKEAPRDDVSDYQIDRWADGDGAGRNAKIAYAHALTSEKGKVVIAEVNDVLAKGVRAINALGFTVEGARRSGSGTPQSNHARVINSKMAGVAGAFSRYAKKLTELEKGFKLGAQYKVDDAMRGVDDAIAELKAAIKADPYIKRVETKTETKAETKAATSDLKAVIEKYIAEVDGSYGTMAGIGSVPSKNVADVAKVFEELGWQRYRPGSWVSPDGSISASFRVDVSGNDVSIMVKENEYTPVDGDGKIWRGPKEGMTYRDLESRQQEIQNQLDNRRRKIQQGFGQNGLTRDDLNELKAEALALAKWAKTNKIHLANMVEDRAKMIAEEADFLLDLQKKGKGVKTGGQIQKPRAAEDRDVQEADAGANRELREAPASGSRRDPLAPLGSRETEWDSDDTAAEDNAEAGEAFETGALESRDQGRAYAFTQRASVYDAVFAAAGITPEDAHSMPADAQLKIAINQVKKDLGFAGIEVSDRLPVRSAIDQLMDLYRNGHFMAASLGIPLNALSLNGRISLKLEPGNRIKYFGVYRGGKHQIGLPGRSRSFAHEWGHAVDHYLMEQIRDALVDPTGTEEWLATQSTRNSGLHPVPDTVAEALINVVNALYFDDAKLAAKVLAIETQIAKTTSDKVKERLEAQLDRILQGSSKISGATSEFRQNAISQDGGAPGYYASIHEMFARATEAYVAAAVTEQGQGGGLEGIAKELGIYATNTSGIFDKIYPRGAEGDRVMQAMRDFFSYLSAEGVLGQGVASLPANDSVFDPKTFSRTAPNKRNLWQRIMHEFHVDRAAQKKADARWDDGKTGKAKGAWNFVKRAAHQFTASTRSYLRHMERAYPNSKALREFSNLVADRPGSSNYSPMYLEEESSRTSRLLKNQLSNILANHGMDAMTDQQETALRRILTSTEAQWEDRVKEAKRLYGVTFTMGASMIRRLLDDVWQRATAAGIPVGYVSRQGWLPRIYDVAKIFADLVGFQRDAAKVYEIVFEENFGPADNADPKELVGLARQLRKFGALPADVLEKAIAVQRHLLQISRIERAIKQGKQDEDTGREKIEKLTAELAPMTAELFDALKPVWASKAAADWAYNLTAPNDFLDYGSMQPNQKWTKKRVLPVETDDILEKWMVREPTNLIVTYIDQASRRIAYTKRFGHDGSKLKGLVAQMVNEGIHPDDIDEIQKVAHLIAGRVSNVLPAQVASAIDWVGNVMTLANLSGTVLTSLPEAAVNGLTSRSVVNGVKALLETIAPEGDKVAIAKAMGIVSDVMMEHIGANRLGLDYENDPRMAVRMSRYFDRNYLTPLTNKQRGITTIYGIHFIRELADAAKTGTPSQQAYAREQLRDYGIADDITDSFIDYVLAMPERASVDSVISALHDHSILPDGRTAQDIAQPWANAVFRYVNRTIQEPKKIDKPMTALTPGLRVIYNLTSFTYSFWDNASKPAYRAVVASMKHGQTMPTVNLFFAATTLFMLHFLLAAMRQWEDPERREKAQEKGDLWWQTAMRAFINLGAVPTSVGTIANLLSAAKFKTDFGGMVGGVVTNSLNQLINPSVAPLASAIRSMVLEDKRSERQQAQELNLAVRQMWKVAVLGGMYMATGLAMPRPLGSLLALAQYGSTRNAFAGGVVADSLAPVPAKKGGNKLPGLPKADKPPKLKGL